MIQRPPLQITWDEAAKPSSYARAEYGLFSCALVSAWPRGRVSYLSPQLLDKQPDPYLESGRVFPFLHDLRQVN